MSLFAGYFDHEKTIQQKKKKVRKPANNLLDKKLNNFIVIVFVL